MGWINKTTKDKLAVIMAAYRKEGPITLRRAYYVLLTAGFFDLTKSANKDYADHLYQALSALFVKCREGGYLPPEAIVDRVRSFIKRPAFPTFAECFADSFENYAQDSMTGQDRAVEAWLEKDTMRDTFLKDCYFRDVPLVISRGFTSWTFKHDAAERFAGYGKPVTVLYAGDFDAEGEHIPAILQEFIREHLPGLDLDFRKVLLTAEDFAQLRQYRVEFKPTKKHLQSAYVRDFVERFGPWKLEVEALPFDETRRRFREALASAINQRVVEAIDGRASRNKRAWLKRHYRP